MAKVFLSPHFVGVKLHSPFPFCSPPIPIINRSLILKSPCHLINFVYHRAQHKNYVRVIDRQLRRFEAPIMTEIVCNNTIVSCGVLYQGAASWNELPVHERNIQDFEKFKQVQKKKLIRWKYKCILGAMVYHRPRSMCVMCVNR